VRAYAPNITNIEKEGEGWRRCRIGCPAGAERRRHRGDAAKGEERDATPDLLLKISRCSTCNIHLMIYKTLKTCI
jgi:hypothetical protein